MPRCWGCNLLLDQENDSAAHVIPNALGGRLAPKGLICRKCNNVLDHIADNALVEAFGAWPTLLDIPRQRGNNPSKKIISRSGYKLRLEADGKLTREDIGYSVTTVPGGEMVEISAGNLKIAQQLIKRAAKQFPQLDPALAEKHARTVSMDPSEEIQLNIDFSPKAVFGGAAAAFWLFFLVKSGQALMSWELLIEFIGAAQRSESKLRYLINGLPGLNGPQINIGHKIIIRTVPSTGELIAYLEILGVLKIGGLLAKGPVGKHIEYIYTDDIIQKIDRSNEFTINSSIFDAQDWLSVGFGISDGEKLKIHLREAMAPFVQHYYERDIAKENHQN